MATSLVNHPKHYNRRVPGVECIDVVRWFNFNLGNVIKYVWRAGDKGDEIQDLEKAVWYLQNEIERLRFLRQQEIIKLADDETKAPGTYDADRFRIGDWDKENG